MSLPTRMVIAFAGSAMVAAAIGWSIVLGYKIRLR